jgi:hypothetical protein
MQIVKSENTLQNLKRTLEDVKKEIIEKEKTLAFLDINFGDIFINTTNQRYYIRVQPADKDKKLGLDLYTGRIVEFQGYERVRFANIQLVEK